MDKYLLLKDGRLAFSYDSYKNGRGFRVDIVPILVIHSPNGGRFPCKDMWLDGATPIGRDAFRWNLHAAQNGVKFEIDPEKPTQLRHKKENQGNAKRKNDQALQANA